MVKRIIAIALALNLFMQCFSVAHSQTAPAPQYVVGLAFLGGYPDNAAEIEAYLQGVLSSDYLNGLHVVASYGGAVAAPANAAGVAAFVAGLPATMRWIVVVPEGTPLLFGDADGYHILTVYAVVQNSPFSGALQRTLAHEVVELLDPRQREAADACATSLPQANSLGVVVPYAGDAGCTVGAH